MFARQRCAILQRSHGTGKNATCPISQALAPRYCLGGVLLQPAGARTPTMQYAVATQVIPASPNGGYRTRLGITPDRMSIPSRWFHSFHTSTDGVSKSRGPASNLLGVEGKGCNASSSRKPPGYGKGERCIHSQEGPSLPGSRRSAESVSGTCQLVRCPVSF